MKIRSAWSSGWAHATWPRTSNGLVVNIVLGAVAFILDPDVITAILRHLRRQGRDPRVLPEHDSLFTSRAPP
jgi:hypothetical protein